MALGNDCSAPVPYAVTTLDNYSDLIELLSAEAVRQISASEELRHGFCHKQ
jgi:hypothetical protein